MKKPMTTEHSSEGDLKYKIILIVMVIAIIGAWCLIYNKCVI